MNNEPTTALSVLKKTRTQMRSNAKIGEYDLPVILKAMHVFAELQQQVKVEPEVKPACKMERPKLENFLPEDTTTDMINNMFLENIELYNYINALDQYIDELEGKSV